MCHYIPNPLLIEIFVCDEIPYEKKEIEGIQEVPDNKSQAYGRPGQQF
jgi:hypothetical protein